MRLQLSKAQNLISRSRRIFTNLKPTTRRKDKDWLGRKRQTGPDWLGRQQRTGPDWLGRKQDK